MPVDVPTFSLCITTPRVGESVWEGAKVGGVGFGAGSFVSSRGRGMASAIRATSLPVLKRVFVDTYLSLYRREASLVLSRPMQLSPNLAERRLPAI